jgi:hypothetical protein
MDGFCLGGIDALFRAAIIAVVRAVVDLGWSVEPDLVRRCSRCLFVGGLEGLSLGSLCVRAKGVAESEGERWVKRPWLHAVSPKGFQGIGLRLRW